MFFPPKSGEDQKKGLHGNLGLSSAGICRIYSCWLALDCFIIQRSNLDGWMSKSRWGNAKSRWGDAFPRQFKYWDHISHVFNVKLPDLRDLETVKFEHLHFLKKLPPQLSNIFVKTSKISTRLTRSTCPSNNLSLYIPKFQTARLQRSIKYKGVKIWNAIPTNIQTETPRLFKTKL